MCNQLWSAVIREYPNIKTWSIAGHSLGGTAASQFVINNPGVVAGLVFWASYPISPMPNDPTRLISIYGTRDGVLRRAGAAMLEGTPVETKLIAIEGGNHAMFASYGEQKGDNPPAISYEVARGQIVAATAGFLETLP